MGDPARSKVADKVLYSMMAAGPAGRFPGSNSHGYGIPVGSRKKDAAWEFIKWALSKEMVMRVVTEQGYAAPCRLSVITSPEFRERMTLNDQDLTKLYIEVLELGGREGYMKYRTVPIFPQVGAQINTAIEWIATGQMSAAEAMREAQAEAIAELKRAGVPVDE